MAQLSETENHNFNSKVETYQSQKSPEVGSKRAKLWYAFHNLVERSNSLSSSSLFYNYIFKLL